MKKLYYIEDIRNTSTENGEQEVVLFGATSDEDHEALVVSQDAGISTYPNDKGMPIALAANNYVYYDTDTPGRFENGNLSTFARRMRAKASYYLRLINQANVNFQPELPREQFFAPDTPNLQVRSFHVNVGHGNCTLILAIRGNFYQLWCVDCSIYDYRNRQNYAQNIEESMKEISKLIGTPTEQLRISYFMLTHTHYDHFSGIEYLFSKRYVNHSTVFYTNLHYGCVSPSWVRVLNLLSIHKCHVVEPLKNAHPVLKVLFPEIRQVSKVPRKPATVPYRVVSTPNDSSVVYAIAIAGKSMILPGDLEQAGLREMMGHEACAPDYCYGTYYCISHHASATGHLDIPCTGTRNYPTPLDCVRHNLKYAIVMGRDNAFSGIYAPNVIGDFGQSIVYSEKDNNGNPIKVMELDWITNSIAYHY